MTITFWILWWFEIEKLDKSAFRFKLNEFLPHLYSGEVTSYCFSSSCLWSLSASTDVFLQSSYSSLLADFVWSSASCSVLPGLVFHVLHRQ